MQVDAIGSSEVAEVALNVPGIIHLIFHVFLRSNADILAIRPVKSVRTKKQRFRLFGPSDLEMAPHITSPVLLEKEEGKRLDDDNHKLMNDIRRSSHGGTYHSPPPAAADITIPQNTKYRTNVRAETTRSMRSPPQVLLSPCTPRKPSKYSIFPTFGSAMLRISSSTTFSQDNEEVLLPPEPVLPFSHKRDLSEQSSGTVQIGCRLSNLNDTRYHPYMSPTATSFRLQLYGTDRSRFESPPISPLSTRPLEADRTSSDIVVLPIQTSQGNREMSPRHSRSGYFVSVWPARRQISSRSQHERWQRMTMKSLPPDPPIEDRQRPPDHE